MSGTGIKCGDSWTVSTVVADLTLNDFKMDHTGNLKHHQEELAGLPPGAFTVVIHDELHEDADIRPGAFFCLRSENAKVTVNSTYSQCPHFLVFIADDGEVVLNFTHTRRFLDTVKKHSLGHPKPDHRAHEILAGVTVGGADMTQYQTLLRQAVAAVSGKAEEQGVESLFRRSGTTMSGESNLVLADFEVVAYLVVLPGGTS